MRLKELLDPKDIDYNLVYHNRLNPSLWQNNNLRPEVAKKLNEIAKLFIEFLEIPNSDVEDVVITGSNANYNWTKYSDIDLHIILNLDRLRDNCPDLTDEYLNAKKKIWNDLHDIKIYGFEVELYAQDADEVHIATGVYSLVDKKWIVTPKKLEPKIDDSAVKVKIAHLVDMIDEFVNGQCDNPERINRVREKITKMRRTGLQRAGEFSVENLAFKWLRNKGYLDKLYKCYNDAIDKDLSL